VYEITGSNNANCIFCIFSGVLIFLRSLSNNLFVKSSIIKIITFFFYLKKTKYQNIMKFEDIDINNITLEKSVKTSFDIRFNGNSIEFWTPELYVPFGIEPKFNNYFLNLELKGDNNSIKLFQYFIETFEAKIIELLDIPNELLNSQLRYTDNNSILYTKVYEKYKKFITNVKNKDDSFVNIFDLEKDNYVTVNLIVDKLWFINGMYYYKFKLKDIIIC
jgi:hypothetical protein